MTLSKGDLILYDSRTMHCGGANSSETRRSVLCISCMGPGIRPDGTTWTMLPALRNRLWLQDLPLDESEKRAPANTWQDSEVHLPPQPLGGVKAARAAVGYERKPVPPLEEWVAAVQCTLCRRWRPCASEEAPTLTSLDAGFQCPLVGCTDAEIDALF